MLAHAHAFFNFIIFILIKKLKPSRTCTLLSASLQLRMKNVAIATRPHA